MYAIPPSPALSAAVCWVALSLPATLAAQDKAAEAARPWTLMIYGGSDNDSERSFCPDMADMRDALATDEASAVLCLADRSAKYSDRPGPFGEDYTGMRLYELTRAVATRLDGGDLLPSARIDAGATADSGDAHNVRGLVRYAKRNYPAQRYALLFYSHGNGAQWCPDEGEGTALFPAELSAVLGEDERVDLMVFDVCEMASIENAYQWRARPGAFSADVMVATPMAGVPFPWADIVNAGALASDDAVEFARIVVAQTEAHRRREAGMQHSARVRQMIDREAMVGVDLRRIEPVVEALQQVARGLAAAEDGRQLLAAIAGGEPAAAVRYGGPLVDVLDLGARLAERGTGAAVREAGAALAAAVDDAVFASYGMDAYAAGEGFRPGAHGLQVTLPPLDTPAEPLWRRLQWYTPLQRRAKGRSYGELEICAAGATPGDGRVDNWFELLDAWLDPGEDDRNGYRY